MPLPYVTTCKLEGKVDYPCGHQITMHGNKARKFQSSEQRFILSNTQRNCIYERGGRTKHTWAAESELKPHVKVKRVNEREQFLNKK